jgi:hypothetical protein
MNASSKDPGPGVNDLRRSHIDKLEALFREMASEPYGNLKHSANIG